MSRVVIPFCCLLIVASASGQPVPVLTWTPVYSPPIVVIPRGQQVERYYYLSSGESFSLAGSTPSSVAWPTQPANNRPAIIVREYFLTTPKGPTNSIDKIVPAPAIDGAERKPITPPPPPPPATNSLAKPAVETPAKKNESPADTQTKKAESAKPASPANPSLAPPPGKLESPPKATDPLPPVSQKQP